MTYMLLLNCTLKLVEEIILYYDARSKERQVAVKVYVDGAFLLVLLRNGLIQSGTIYLIQTEMEVISVSVIIFKDDIGGGRYSI